MVLTIKQVAYAMAIKAVVILISMQVATMESLLTAPVLSWPMTELGVGLAFIICWLHGMLVLGLLMGRRWRFLVTLWLNAGFKLFLIQCWMCVYSVLFEDGHPGNAIAPVAILWLAWLNAYYYVETDQKTRDKQRAKRAAAAAREARRRARRRGQTATNGTQGDAPADGALQLANLDPTGLYLLVPSHTEPPLPTTPFWEADLETWRMMARFFRTTTSSFSRYLDDE